MGYWDAYWLPVQVRKYLIRQHQELTTPKEQRNNTRPKKPMPKTGPMESRPVAKPAVFQSPTRR